MKKLLLLISAVTMNISLIKAQLPNGGFETWTAGLPDGWWAYTIPPYNLYSQSSMAHSGSYAVSLLVENILGTPSITPLLTGNDMGGSTLPISIVPNSVTFWYRLNSSADELIMSMVVYSGGMGVGSSFAAVPPAANYTQVSAPVYYTVAPATADSVSIVFNISNLAGNVTPGTQAWIDDVNVSTSTGTMELAGSPVKIYPNPASDLLQIDLTMNGNELYIYDAYGRQISNYATEGKNFAILTSDLPAGIYHCLIRNSGSQSVHPFVIHR